MTTYSFLMPFAIAGVLWGIAWALWRFSKEE